MFTTIRVAVVFFSRSARRDDGRVTTALMNPTPILWLTRYRNRTARTAGTASRHLPVSVGGLDLRGEAIEVAGDRNVVQDFQAPEHVRVLG